METRRKIVLYLLLALLAGGVGLPWTEGVGAPVINRGSPAEGPGMWGLTSLRLIGTAVSSDRLDCFAVVVDMRTRRQRYLREGDDIDGISVRRILSDRIIIQAGSEDRVVKMSHLLSEGSPGVAVAPVDAAVEPARRGRYQERMVDRRDVALLNPGSEDALSTIDVKAGTLLNQRNGLRIAGLKPDSIFEKIGLRRGDLIIGINDRSIDSAEDLRTLLETMTRDNPVELTLRRRARTYHFNLLVD